MADDKNTKLHPEEYAAIANAVKEILQKEKKSDLKQQRDNRIANVRLTLENYRKFKAYAQNAIGSISQAKSVLEKMLQDVWTLDDDELKVESIIQTKERTLVMIAQIEKGVQAYKAFCESDPDETAMRRYKILYERFISDCTLHPSIDSLAAKFSIERRTVFADISRACDEIGPFIFGTMWR